MGAGWFSTAGTEDADRGVDPVVPGHRSSRHIGGAPSELRVLDRVQTSGFFSFLLTIFIIYHLLYIINPLGLVAIINK